MTLAQQMLDIYIQAEKDVLEGKSVDFQGQRMTLEDLDKIREGRKEWERRVDQESNQNPIYSLASWE